MQEAHIPETQVLSGAGSWCRTGASKAIPLRAVMIGGAPWFRLRDILKATDHRPFFIRQGLLSLEGLKKFLQRSDKPLAPRLLAQVAQQFP